jgi:hypothetical protein
MDDQGTIVTKKPWQFDKPGQRDSCFDIENVGISFLCELSDPDATRQFGRVTPSRKTVRAVSMVGSGHSSSDEEQWQ